jgi:long-chain acyl-CoA synthetase
MLLTIKDIVNYNSEHYPDKTAFIFEGRKFTFKQVNNRVNSLINALKSMGVKKGDHVGILAYNCSQYFEVFALAKAGLVAVPLNFRSVASELEYLINNSGISTLIVEKEFVELVSTIKPKINSVKNFICLDANIDGMHNYELLIGGFPSDEPAETVNENDIAAIYYSSGTTGRPKGAIHTHKSLVAEMLLPVKLPVLDLTFNDIALCVMPFFHVGGSAAHMLSVFAMGATSIVLKKFDEEAVLQAIQDYKITYVCLVPAMIIRLMDYPGLNKFDLSSLKTIAYTGAPMALVVMKRAIRQFGSILVQSLGQTETLKMTALSKADHKLEGSPRELRRLESAGKPPSPGEIRITDKQGKEVKPGTPGEIAIRSDRMMSGYWKMPKETAETIKDGWLYTGDVGIMDEDGYFYLVDRKKDMIISGGENIYSREVEDVLISHPAINEAVVIAIPDANWGEAVKALVILREGMTCTEKEIIDFCKNRLASYKKPKSVEFWNIFPKTATGKIKKSEIRDKYWAGYTRKIN